MPSKQPKGIAESRRSPPRRPRSTTGSDLGSAAVSWRTLWRFGPASGPQFGQKLVGLLLFDGVGVCLHLAEGFVGQRPFGSCREQIKDEGANRHQFGQQNWVGIHTLSGAQSGEYCLTYPGGTASLSCYGGHERACHNTAHSMCSRRERFGAARRVGQNVAPALVRGIA
jgi:hypothetical protein